MRFIGIYCRPNNPQPILVTEEVTLNLLCYLDKVEMQESEKYRFSCGVGDGLAYLHRQKIAHLNLYTKSIFVTDNLTVKIANFEYASYFDQNATSSSSASLVADSFKFRDKTVFNFLPQDYLDRRCDLVDIYSFGCVVFNIFTCKQPTPQIKSQTAEISIAEVGALVEDCLHGKKESMQEIFAALNV